MGSNVWIVGFFARLLVTEWGHDEPLYAVRRSGEAKKEDVEA